MDQAGEFRCGLVLADIRAVAEVVVLDNFGCVPFIQPPPYEPNPPKIIEDMIMVFTCSVLGDGYKAPTLEWWNMNGEVTSGSYFDPDTKTATAMANLTATGEMDMMHFECRLFFEQEDGEADEPPRYEDRCISYYEVEYAPRNIEISPNPDEEVDAILNLYTGDHVNCTASGNPEPTYIWYEKDLGDVSYRSTLIITEDMTDRDEFPVTWVCQAKNKVDGHDRLTVREVKMNIEAPSSGQPSILVPLVGGLVPAVIIIAVLVAVIVWLVRRRSSNEDKQPAAESGQSHSQDISLAPVDSSEYATIDDASESTQLNRPREIEHPVTQHGGVKEASAVEHSAAPVYVNQAVVDQGESAYEKPSYVKQDSAPYETPIGRRDDVEYENTETFIKQGK